MRRNALAAKGFTTLEILISLSISAIVGVALMSIMNMMNSAKTNMNSQMGRDSFRAVLLQAFEHPTLCETTVSFTSLLIPAYSNKTFWNASQALPGVAPNGLGLPLNLTLNVSNPNGIGAIRINSQDPAAPPQPAKPLPQFNIAYQYILFTNARVVGSDPANPKNTLYQGLVTLTATKLEGQSDLTTPIVGGNALTTQVIGSLLLSVNTGNGIDSCETYSPVDDACTQAGGVPNTFGGPGPQCIFNTPCSSGQIFAGLSATQTPICETVPTCGNNTGLVPNGTGGLKCAAP